MMRLFLTQWVWEVKDVVLKQRSSPPSPLGWQPLNFLEVYLWG